jgi:hypothetical protein
MFTEVEALIKLLSSNPSSVMVFLLVGPLAVFYIFKTTWRVAAIERKLGLRAPLNGGNVVVTRSDLLEFEARLFDKLDKKFVPGNICELKHADSERRIKTLEEFRGTQ